MGKDKFHVTQVHGEWCVYRNGKYYSGRGKKLSRAQATEDAHSAMHSNECSYCGRTDTARDASSGRCVQGTGCNDNDGGPADPYGAS